MDSRKTEITLRYAITEFCHWYGAIVVASYRGVIHHADGALKILEINEAMQDWLGDDVMDMHFMDRHE
jgi:hypothetical protein